LNLKLSKECVVQVPKELAHDSLDGCEILRRLDWLGEILFFESTLPLRDEGVLEEDGH